ncbi:DUF3078 domain-containing protein [Seonamhaeicola maritimus]|uniref:DUF3078 domain-containing protein n=1 Tax=Seonamhaeicola maritimus TaxID=2591822 RepID=A0A5C7GEC2_9FLAO|nr:DUF3078 domain-containing protein [Seonamhaeicola maritimus]TXG35183.1 DUF3078 domain-containing protein [Seonamhaeicola maritimus]
MRYILFALVCFSFQFSNAQPDSLYLKEKPKKYDGPQWKIKNKASVDLSEVAFVNWNAGGANSISGLLGLESSRNYSDKYFSWRNNLIMRYGVNKQQSRELRKTDDLFEINSNMGYKPDIKSNWYYSARLNFRTQFANGYKYPNKETPISRLMAPGYLFFGGGMEYGKRIDKLSLYFSPVTLKATFVLDEDLANAGAFGVDPAVLDDQGNIVVPGKRIRKELGILVTNSYEMEVAENINMVHKVGLYTDYINNFGNVDLDWRLDFDFKVNNYVRARFGSHIRYDDDVKTSKETDVEGEFDEAGAKIQWKQFLGVGFAVDF